MPYKDKEKAKAYNKERKRKRKEPKDKLRMLQGLPLGSIKGKTFEEYYGKNQAEEIKVNMKKGMKNWKPRNKWGKKIDWSDKEQVRAYWRFRDKLRRPHKPGIRGKSFEEFYGVEKAKQLKAQISETSKKREGRPNPNKGMTIEQIFGEEKASKIKKKMREASKHSNLGKHLSEETIKNMSAKCGLKKKRKDI
jgi:hypothetical protein